MKWDLPTILIVAGLVIAAIDIITIGYLFPFAIALFFTCVVGLFVKDYVLLSIVFTIQTVIYYALFIIWNRKQKVVLEEEKVGFVKRKEGNYYIVEFPTGYKGDIEWKAVSDYQLKIGDRVKVKGIDGNILIVVPAD